MSIHIGEGITTVTATMYKTGKTPAKEGTSTTAILIGGAAAVAIVGLAAMSKKKR